MLNGLVFRNWNRFFARNYFLVELKKNRKKRNGQTDPPRSNHHPSSFFFLYLALKGLKEEQFSPFPSFSAKSRVMIFFRATKKTQQQNNKKNEKREEEGRKPRPAFTFFSFLYTL